MSKRKSSRRSRRRRSRGMDPLMWMGIGVGAIITFFVFSAWQSGAFAKPPAPSRSEDSTELLPLAESGQLLQGGHEMSLIPEQTPAPQPAPLDEPVPHLDLPSIAHDFGRIYEVWDVVHTFAVQNTGTADLVIGNLVTSCGCTTAQLSSTVIPPGQRADLTVTFDANYHQTKGEVSRIVWFASNDPTQPWVEIRLTADVR